MLREAPALARAWVVAARPSPARLAPFARRASASAQLAQDVRRRTEEVTHKILLPLNDRMMGPLERHESSPTVPLPYVLLLGNHSSGKSSFINFVLGRTIQQAGVAPTDDCFTVIAPGAADTDRDGPSFVGDPDLGFGPLRNFGPGLLNHVQLKVRSGLAVDGLMLIDSPGMIDSPGSGGPAPAALPGILGAAVGSGAPPPRSASLDRGYDFLGVVRWLAERADVVLLFFDPDKPGTTGETLECLTSSLFGVNHKLHIILNKVDRFEQIHDFARAYGSLCWNLAKVIPRKDLPRIYTMYLPGVGPGGARKGAAPQSALAAPLQSLDGVRDEVVAEVLRAPERRVDNMITRLYEAARMLHMHCAVAEEARRRYTREAWQQWSLCAGLLGAGPALAAGGAFCGLPMGPVAGVAALAGVAAAVSAVHASRALHRVGESLATTAGLDSCFQHTHSRELAEGDQFAAALWQRISPQLRTAVATVGISNLPRVSAAELARVRQIAETDVPQLRRMSAPQLVPGKATTRREVQAPARPPSPAAPSPPTSGSDA
eukprot:CAMPEP_0206019596 /NCGR_PEP_ID=MMETSP1464-20131121/29392_1 /ASSEMBLY_ACC=CAM_ASM_001124 /TAXON_ID=119497 /ORGANISM="Exanthemachrysis gayraliae, Strain RCC1523" /LENGTH=545 /DNA_ID=CAMNT_0053393499 /DNA_START=1 /DNA_END=1638 /DNA_ORIENTATION=+